MMMARTVMMMPSPTSASASASASSASIANNVDSNDEQGASSSALKRCFTTSRSSLLLSILISLILISPPPLTTAQSLTTTTRSPSPTSSIQFLSNTVSLFFAPNQTDKVFSPCVDCKYNFTLCPDLQTYCGAPRNPFGVRVRPMVRIEIDWIFKAGADDIPKYKMNLFLRGNGDRDISLTENNNITLDTSGGTVRFPQPAAQPYELIKRIYYNDNTVAENIEFNIFIEPPSVTWPAFLTATPPSSQPTQPSVPPPPPSSPAPAPAAAIGLSQGAIIGISVSVISIIVSTLVVMYVIRRMHRKYMAMAAKKDQEATTALDEKQMEVGVVMPQAEAMSGDKSLPGLRWDALVGYHDDSVKTPVSPGTMEHAVASVTTRSVKPVRQESDNYSSAFEVGSNQAWVSTPYGTGSMGRNSVGSSHRVVYRQQLGDGVSMRSRMSGEFDRAVSLHRVIPVRRGSNAATSAASVMETGEGVFNDMDSNVSDDGVEVVMPGHLKPPLTGSLSVSPVPRSERGRGSLPRLKTGSGSGAGMAPASPTPSSGSVTPAQALLAKRRSVSLDRSVLEEGMKRNRSASRTRVLQVGRLNSGTSGASVVLVGGVGVGRERGGSASSPVRERGASTSSPVRERGTSVSSRASGGYEVVIVGSETMPYGDPDENSLDDDDPDAWRKEGEDEEERRERERGRKT